MSRPAWPYGAALVGGAPKYFSPSALMTADPDSESGCLRKWWFQYVKKLKEPETGAQAEGTALHASIENYLVTGRREDLNALALPGLHMLPRPGPDLMIEHDIVGGDLKNAPLRAAGVPIAGFIDLVHRRCVNEGGSDVTDVQDPPNTVSITDWKSTSNIKYIKSPKEMADTLQMTTYGKWALTKWPESEWVRLSHGYFITKGKNVPKKVSLRVHRDQIDQRWKHIDKLAGYLVDVAKETNQDKIPGNARACDAYRGCFHRDYCSYAMHNSLDSLGAPSTATITLDELGYQEPQGDTVTGTSLLARLKNKNADATATTEPKKPNPADVAAEKSRLAKEEVLARWPGLDDVFKGFDELGMGKPALAGDAAKAYATLNGLKLESDALAGTGDLGSFTFSDPTELPAVLAEARDIVAGKTAESEPQAEAPAAVLPPDAPSAKVVAAPPAPPVAADAAIEAAAETPGKKKPGRPKKEAAATVSPEVDAAIAAAEASVTTDSTAAVPVTIVEAKLYFYVDCVPLASGESFWPLVNDILETLAKKHHTDDIRCAPNKDSVLAFGGWKGILAHALRVASAKIPAGRYVLDGASSEIGQVVAETMRDVMAKNGGEFVRGTR
jgi:hypothetical protein